MNEQEKTKIVEGFKESHTQEEIDEALRDKKLLFKAMIFLQHKACRRCRLRILRSARTGERFDRDILCQFCAMIFDRQTQK